MTFQICLLSLKRTYSFRTHRAACLRIIRERILQNPSNLPLIKITLIIQNLPAIDFL